MGLLAAAPFLSEAAIIIAAFVFTPLMVGAMGFTTMLDNEVRKNNEKAVVLAQKIVGKLRKKGAFAEVRTVLQEESTANYQISRWLKDPGFNISPLISPEGSAKAIVAMFEFAEWKTPPRVLNLMKRMSVHPILSSVIESDEKLHSFFTSKGIVQGQNIGVQSEEELKRGIGPSGGIELSPEAQELARSQLKENERRWAKGEGPGGTGPALN